MVRDWLAIVYTRKWYSRRLELTCYNHRGEMAGMKTQIPTTRVRL